MKHLIMIIFLSFFNIINPQNFYIKSCKIIVNIELEKKIFKKNENIYSQIKIINKTKNDIRLPRFPEVSLLVNNIPKISNTNKSDFYIELKVRGKKSWEYYNYENYSEIQDISDTIGFSNNIISSCSSETYDICLLPANQLSKNNYLIRICFLAGKYCECKNVYSNWFEFEVK